MEILSYGLKMIGHMMICAENHEYAGMSRYAIWMPSQPQASLTM